MAHPLVESYLPVSYAPEEIGTCKRRLDPTGSRSRFDANPDTDARIQRVAATLGISEHQARSYMGEARRVELSPPPESDDNQLASPMCFEDRYTVYVVTRALAPTSVIETGIAYGVSSAYILAAMDAADTGSLISIERSRDPRIGAHVPQELRSRWSVRTGTSLTVLPPLLEDCGEIDLFIHDSWHGYWNMRREYELAWKYIRPGGVLCSHDILATNAFPRFVQAHRGEIATWIASVNFGLIKKQDG